MAGDEKPGSWWQTLPGVLTAIAGFIAAVSGLILALNQAGLLGGANDKQAQGPPGPAATTAPAPHPEAQPEAPRPRTEPPGKSEAPMPATVARPESPAQRALSASPPCPTPRVVLRSAAAVLSRDEVARMVAQRGFFDENLNPGHAGFANEFRPHDFRGDKVVVDFATCLMWKQSASPNPVTWYDAPNYARELNAGRFAGFADWRVPTIEELASLMEPRKGSAGYHLDALFDLGPRKVPGCWSVDRKEYPTAADTAWPAGFSYGGLIHLGNAGNPMCVLAVRSLQ